MITDIFLWVVFGLVKILLAILNGFNVLVPTWVETTLASAFAQMGIISAYLPINAHPELTGLTATIGLADIFNFVLLAAIAKFGIVLVLKVWAVVPHIGKKVEL